MRMENIWLVFTALFCIKCSAVCTTIWPRCQSAQRKQNTNAGNYCGSRHLENNHIELWKHVPGSFSHMALLHKVEMRNVGGAKFTCLWSVSSNMTAYLVFLLLTFAAIVAANFTFNDIPGLYKKVLGNIKLCEPTSNSPRTLEGNALQT